MSIDAKDILRILIERIEYSHPSPAVFRGDETSEWPEGVQSDLVVTGVLATAGARAKAAVCPGCEEQCIKAAVVRLAGDNARRAFIICDEDADLGRIELPVEALDQYVSSLRSLAAHLARELQLGPVRSPESGSIFVLGTWKGRQGAKPVQISIEDGRLVLGVGRQREPLLNALKWTGSRLAIHRRVVRRLADRKEPEWRSGGNRLPDNSRQRERARATRSRDAAIFTEAIRLKAGRLPNWTEIAKTISGTELGCGLSEGRIRRIIADCRKNERKFSRAKGTSRKH